MSDADMNDDLRTDLLGELRAILEWEQLCGAEVWPSDHFARWPVRLPEPKRRARSEPKHRGQSEPKNQTLPPSRQPVRKPQRTHQFSETSIPTSIPASNPVNQSAWGKVLEHRPVTLQLETLATGAAGMSQLRNHQQQHCLCRVPCRLGGGVIDAPVLLIEGHPRGLDGDALAMLGKMRDAVLKLPKEQLYWMQIGVGQQCESCASLFQAHLSLLSPRLVLAMGPIKELSLFKAPPQNRSSNVYDEGWLNLSTSRGDVPVMVTHHPQTLLDNPELKRQTMTHLQAFHRRCVREQIIERGGR